MTEERRALAQRGRLLEYFTIGWNSLEGVIAVLAGASAGSISLVGFGIDSFIEVSSGAALLWRMAVDADEQERQRRERLTLRLVGVSFLLLSGYVCVEAIRDLIDRSAPASTRIGIALACVSLVVMPLLSRAKRRVGRALGSAAMQADATQAAFCSWLSAILLGGLLFNSAFGLWWADPVAALVMTPIIAKEGIEGLRGDPCCDAR
jgi:divalent metal cation (Fe/Co/Zn/Cd) transporter